LKQRRLVSFRPHGILFVALQQCFAKLFINRAGKGAVVGPLLLQRSITLQLREIHTMLRGDKVGEFRQKYRYPLGVISGHGRSRL
jgi:hypothetical protein